jgi:hypothetical protein
MTSFIGDGYVVKWLLADTDPPFLIISVQLYFVVIWECLWRWSIPVGEIRVPRS